MKVLIVMLVAAFVAANARAEDARAAFDAGNYLTAAKALEAELTAGSPTAEGYANLALAYQKAGDATQAAINYERALLLDPGLKSAHNALAALAQQQHIPLPPHTWTDDVTAVVHPDTLVGLGAVLFWAGAFGLVFISQSAKRRPVGTSLATVGLVFGGVAVAAGCFADSRLASGQPAAVTAKDGVEVLTAPTNNSTAIISLPPGSPVRAISPRGAWTYVDLAGGARGWVQTDQITPLVPGETL